MAVLNLSAKMPAEEESDEVEMESESGEEGVVLHKLKYRELKSRLKYLVYVSSHYCLLMFTIYSSAESMGKGELDNPTVCFPCFRSKRVFRLRFRKHRQSYFSCHETKGLKNLL